MVDDEQNIDPGQHLLSTILIVANRSSPTFFRTKSQIRNKIRFSGFIHTFLNSRLFLTFRLNSSSLPLVTFIHEGQPEREA